MPDGMYAAGLKVVAGRYTLGEFGLLGERAQKVLNTSHRMLRVLAILFGEPESDLLSLIAARGEEVRSLFEVGYNGSLVLWYDDSACGITTG